MTVEELQALNAELLKNNICLLIDNKDGTGYVIISINSQLPLVYEVEKSDTTSSGWTYKNIDNWSLDNMQAIGLSNDDIVELADELSEAIDNGAKIISYPETWWYELV